MSPTCCETSELYRTVTFFEPATQSTPAHWAVPFRNDDGKLSPLGVTPAKFCPFCGTALAREHIPFEAK